MQRTRNLLAAGLVWALLMSLSAQAQAQVFYVTSSSYRTVPIGSSVMVTRSFRTPRYSHSFRAQQAWNSRTSAPAVYFESSYLPAAGDDYPVISSRSVATSRPIVSSRVVSSRPIVVSRSVVYARPVVYSQPVIYSEPVVISRPVRVYRSVSSLPRVTREEIECRPEHYEYEQLGTFEAFDGHRTNTYRYEYEVDQRP